MAPRAWRLAALLVPLAVSACSDSNAKSAAAADAPDGSPPRRPRLASEFCQSPRDDEVRTLFCEGTPDIASLADLQTALHLLIDAADPVYGQAVEPIFLAHSTALSGRLVSPLNPRVIFSSGGSGLILTFQRGVQQVEIAARDRVQSRHNFYLLTFEQACSLTATGCSPGDLFTTKVESNWTNVKLRDDEDLKNTPSDCRQCHQRGRESTILLMRELEAPWTHFFGPVIDRADEAYLKGIDGGLFTTQYQEAKGDERYGNGMVGNERSRPSGFVLELLVDKPQALFFDAAKINGQLHHQGSPSGRSAAWDAAYAGFKRGEQLALPYFGPVVTDPAKLARATSAYRAYLDGALAVEGLPDLSDVFPDDPRTRAEIGLQVEPEATPAEALVQACGSCHNDVLDQSLSRARFNVGLSRLSGDALGAAVDRLLLSPESPGVMPPREGRQLTPAVKERLVQYLRRAEFTEADLAFLDHAAARGMSGGEQPWPTRALPTREY